MKNLILDYANMSSILRFGAMGKVNDTLLMNDDEWKSFFLDSMLIYVSNYIKVLKADRVILAMEHKSWRKDFYSLYKANRAIVKEEDDKLELFYEAMGLAEDFFRKYTNIKVVRGDGAEGDDVIAILAQKLSLNNEKVTIVSTDGDFHQLLKYKNVNIFNPIKKVYKTDYSHLDFITKIIKGDHGDNVPSSYPRIKKEIIEVIANDGDEHHLNKEFSVIDKMITRQKYYLAKLLNVDEIPNDLSDDEFNEVLLIGKEEITKIKELDKTDEEYKRIKNIIKLAKKENITEAKLTSVIPNFKDGYYRNFKLICLDADNIPEHVSMNIIKEFEKDHSASDLGDMFKYARKNKLKEFFFGNEWEVLKNIKNI